MAGTLTISTLSDGTNSTSATNCISGSAKAWATWTGSTGAILASYNVSSITRATAGDYTLNFTNAFADTNYSAQYSSTYSTSSSAVNVISTRTTTTLRVTHTESGAFADATYNSVSVIR